MFQLSGIINYYRIIPAIKFNLPPPPEPSELSISLEAPAPALIMSGVRRFE